MTLEESADYWFLSGCRFADQSLAWGDWDFPKLAEREGECAFNAVEAFQVSARLDELAERRKEEGEMFSVEMKDCGGKVIAASEWDTPQRAAAQLLAGILQSEEMEAEVRRARIAGKLGTVEELTKHEKGARLQAAMLALCDALEDDQRSDVAKQAIRALRGVLEA